MLPEISPEALQENIDKFKAYKAKLVAIKQQMDTSELKQDTEETPKNSNDSQEKSI